MNIPKIKGDKAKITKAAQPILEQFKAGAIKKTPANVAAPAKTAMGPMMKKVLGKT